MTKKEYMNPVLQVIRIQHKRQILTGSLKTQGLGDNPEDNLIQSNTFGNSWDDAMSRRRNDWDDDEEEW